MKKILCMLLACVMVLGIMMPMATLAESTESTDKTVYANGKVWFDLNGNSKFYAQSTDDAWKNRKTYSDYLPGVDYAGYLKEPTGDFATDQKAIDYPGDGGAMFLYTVDAGTKPAQYADPDLKTGADGNIYWTINDVDYLLRTNKKIIKNHHTTVTKTALTDEDMIARYKSLNDPHVIDVPDKKYTSIGVLAGAYVKYTKRL